MSAQPTPRPWAAFTTGSEGCSVTARDVRVPRVARLTSAPLETCQADAALIVAAVNDYDRLRLIEERARAVVTARESYGSSLDLSVVDALRAALEAKP